MISTLENSPALCNGVPALHKTKGTHFLQPALHLRKAQGVSRVEMGCASSHWTAVLVLLSLAHCVKT